MNSTSTHTANENAPTTPHAEYRVPAIDIPDTIDIGAITLMDSLQARVSINDETIQYYAQAMDRGSQFPALTLCYVEGIKNALVDGWHRYHAYKLLGYDNVPIRHMGRLTYINALKLSISLNSNHARPFSAQDRKRACELLLSSDPQISDNNVATMVGCAVSTVSSLRDAIGAHSDTRVVNRVNGDSVHQYTVDITQKFEPSTRAIIEKHGIENPNTKALLNRLVLSTSATEQTIVDDIRDSGHIWIDDTSTPITADYDSVREAIADYKRHQTALILQAQNELDTAPVMVVPFDKTLTADSDSRFIVRLENHNFKTFSAWLSKKVDVRMCSASFEAPTRFYIAIAGTNRDDVRLPSQWRESELLFDIQYLGE